MIRHIILHSPTAYREPATVAQATTDDQVVALWLHARSRHTQRAYLADVERFRALAGKQLHQVTLGDVQDFADSLVSLVRSVTSRLATYPHPCDIGSLRGTTTRVRSAGVRKI